MIVTLRVVSELRADLAAWPPDAVHVDVGSPGSHERVELAGRDGLRYCAGTDIGRSDRARDGATGGRIRLRACRAVAEVRAQEDDDRAVVRFVFEVDVGLASRRSRAR